MISLEKYVDPAPALGRGLIVLSLLSDETEHSLDNLATASRLPKASVLRLLRSLALAGAAVQGADRRWRALCRLAPIGDPQGGQLQRVESTLADLSSRSKRISEYWLPETEALRLHARVEPPGCEVTLRAGIGYLRRAEEIEAVVQVAMAWEHLHPGRRHWHWRAGKPTVISPQALRRHVAGVRAAGTAIDLDANPYGVRRIAAPVLRGGNLIAVLAVAAIGRIEAGEERKLRSILTGAAASLSVFSPAGANPCVSSISTSTP